MKTVTLYTTPTCAFCRALKAFLKEKGVNYEEHNVVADQEKLEEMSRYSGGAMSVPVIVFSKDQPDQEVQVGFDQTKVTAALGL